MKAENIKKGWEKTGLKIKTRRVKRGAKREAPFRDANLHVAIAISDGEFPSWTAPLGCLGDLMSGSFRSHPLPSGGKR